MPLLPVRRPENLELRHLKRDLAISATLTLPIFVIEMGSHLIPAVGHWLHGAVRAAMALHPVLRARHAGAVRAGPALLPERRAGAPSRSRPT